MIRNGLQALGRGLHYLILAIAAIVVTGGLVAFADYAATQGSGTNFASIVISTKHYAGMLICDAINGEPNCSQVDNQGRVQVLAAISGSATVSLSSPNINANVTNTPAVTCAACSTATNQTSEITALNAISTSVAAPIPAGTNLIGGINIAQVGGSSPAVSNPLPIEESTGGAYANRTNWLQGSANTSGSSATTIIAAPASNRLYVGGVQCARTDAGTTAAFVTLNDSASTVLVLPDLGGGGGNNIAFNPPLSVAATTALKFTPSTSLSTVYCNAQGYNAS